MSLMPITVIIDGDIDKKFTSVSRVPVAGEALMMHTDANDSFLRVWAVVHITNPHLRGNGVAEVYAVRCYSKLMLAALRPAPLPTARTDWPAPGGLPPARVDAQSCL